MRPIRPIPWNKRREAITPPDAEFPPEHSENQRDSASQMGPVKCLVPGAQPQRSGVKRDRAATNDMHPTKNVLARTARNFDDRIRSLQVC